MPIKKHDTYPLLGANGKLTFRFLKISGKYQSYTSRILKQNWEHLSHKFKNYITMRIENSSYITYQMIFAIPFALPLNESKQNDAVKRTYIWFRNRV